MWCVCVCVFIASPFDHSCNAYMYNMHTYTHIPTYIQIYINVHNMQGGYGRGLARLTDSGGTGSGNPFFFWSAMHTAKWTIHIGRMLYREDGIGGMSYREDVL